MSADATRSNWFARNWKWAAPTGCLLMVALVGAFIGTIFFFVFSMMKSNDAYQHSLETARHNPAVVAALGQPIEDGWLVSGNFEESGGAGQANFSIPISGPKGSGTLYVEAKKSAGAWNYSNMVLQVDGSGKRIDLLQALPASEATP
jgi:hypothetical protein